MASIGHNEPKADQANYQQDLRQQNIQLHNEDPYAQQRATHNNSGVQLNNQAANDYQLRPESLENNCQEKSRKNSKDRKLRKTTAFEKYDNMRYSGYELDNKIKDLSSTLDSVDTNSNNQSVSIPLEVFLQMKRSTQEISKEFKGVQDQWCSFFDEQLEDNQKQRGKSKNYRKKLKGLENQSILFQKDQKDFERSLQDITKEHNVNTNQIELVLDEMEFKVSELKNTRLDLNLKYESQLDKAVKEMFNFYNNLENHQTGQSDRGEYETNCVNLDRIFFIKPTHEIDLRLQQSSSENSNRDKTRTQKVGQNEYLPENPRPSQVPKLKIDRIESNYEPQPSSLQEFPPPAITNQVENNQIQKSPDKDGTDVVVTNPVMIGGMNMTSAFDPKMEESFAGAGVTLDMNTARLAQFPDDYEMLKHIQNQDERIIMKQMVFLKYERILKKQAKKEKKILKKAAKAKALEKAAQLALHPEKNVAEQKQADPAVNKVEHQGDKEQAISPYNLNLPGQASKSQAPTPSNRCLNDFSHDFISLESELPPMDTIERRQAKFNFKGNNQDVNMSEIVNIEEIAIDGLKTCTQASLIEKISEDFRRKEQMRADLKKDEKKIDYNSSSHSIALINKQLQSDQILQKQYASNNSNGASNPIYIHVDSDQSVNSNPRFQINSTKNLPYGGKNQLDLLNVEISLNEGDQSFLNNQISSSNDKTKQSQNGLNGQGRNFESESQIQGSEKKLAPDISLPNLQNDINEQVNGSFLSGKSQYQRIFEVQNQDGSSPSPLQIQNSYAQSSDQSIDFAEKGQVKYQSYLQNGSNAFDRQDNQDYQYQDQQIQQQQPQQMVDRIDDEVKNIHKLNLEIIPERQSEFSQSMMTNANKMNTNRSRASRASKNQYANMSKGEGTGGGNRSNLPTGRSEINKSSTRQKKGTNENLSVMLNNEQNGIRKRPPSEIEDYKNTYVRSNSQAQTSRNQDSSMQQCAIVSNESSFPIHSRNAAQKVSRSSKEPGYSLKKQTSVGTIEKELKQKYLSNFEMDVNTLMPSFNVHNSKQKKKSNQDMVPPLGRSKQNMFDKRELQDNNEGRSNNRNDNFSINYMVNLTEQNTQQNSERELVQQPQYQPHSHRSHIRAENCESLRDRSYFDESPALFENIESGEIIDNSCQRQRYSNRRDTEICQKTDSQIYDNSQQLHSGTGILMHMQSIPQSDVNSASRGVVHTSKQKNSDSQSICRLKEVVTSETNEDPKQINENQILDDINDENNEEIFKLNEKKQANGLVRSSSECQLRDKQFYEMCDEDDEIAMYYKFAEQNILDSFHVRNLSNYNTKNNVQLHNQSTDNHSQLFAQNANKSSSISNNQLVFMSQQTFKRILGSKYLQTQEKTQIGHQIAQIRDTNTSQILQGDQQSSQQQTRGKATLQKFCYDPTRLLASINNNGAAQQNGPQVNNYLGTNLLTTSLDDGTLFMHHNQIMMPTHAYNRRTMLMMQNLHNNYIYSANSGILFTMQRGWNSGQALTNPKGFTANAPQSLKTLTNIRGISKDTLNNQNSSIGIVSGALQGEPKNEKMASLGGDPVNISNLLMGAKQQTSEQINVGCITIVDDDGKFMMDRKTLLEANNLSNQTNARRLFQQSRNIIEQATTSDFSNLQTKQLGILKNNRSMQGQSNLSVPNTTQNNNINFYSQNFKEESVAFEHDIIPNPITKQSHGLEISDYEAQDCSERQDKKKVINGNNNNRIMNLFNGLQNMKQKQQQNRTGSDLSVINTEQQNSKRVFGSKKLQSEKNSKLSSYRGMNKHADLDSQQSVSQGNISTIKQQAKKGGLSNIKSILKQNEQSKNLNLSQSINSNQFQTQGSINQHAENLALKQQVLSGGNGIVQRASQVAQFQKSIVKLKSKSQPRGSGLQLNNNNKLEMMSKNQEIIDEIRKLQEQNQEIRKDKKQSTGDINLQMLSKKNKMRLVSNIQTNQNNYHTIANDDNLPSAGLPKKHGGKGVGQQKPIKKIGSFVKKGSYQGQVNGQQYYVSQGGMSSARNSSSAMSGSNPVSAVYMNANGKLCIKKKVLNQQMSQNQQMTTNSLI